MVPAVAKRCAECQLILPILAYPGQTSPIGSQSSLCQPNDRATEVYKCEESVKKATQQYTSTKAHIWEQRSAGKTQCMRSGLRQTMIMTFAPALFADLVDCEPRVAHSKMLSPGERLATWPRHWVRDVESWPCSTFQRCNTSDFLVVRSGWVYQQRGSPAPRGLACSYELPCVARLRALR